MFRRSEVVAGDGARPAEGPTSAGTSPRPNLAGDLEALLGPRPLFRTALRGYDRLQVENYVSWAESELLATRRENEDLLARYGACSAELELSRRLLACSPEGREMVRTSERVGEILRLAADEAAQLTEAGQAEADRIRGQARSQADVLLRRAHEVKDQAVAECGRMHEEARRVREDAAAEWELAGAEAARMREDAAAEVAQELQEARAAADRVRAAAVAERQRLAEEAAAQRSREATESAERLAAEEARTLAEVAETCAARIATAQAQVDDLVRRRDEARAALQRLTGQLDDALGTLSDLLREEERAAQEEQVAS